MTSRISVFVLCVLMLAACQTGQLDGQSGSAYGQAETNSSARSYGASGY